MGLYWRMPPRIIGEARLARPIKRGVRREARMTNPHTCGGSCGAKRDANTGELMGKCHSMGQYTTPANNDITERLRAMKSKRGPTIRRMLQGKPPNRGMMGPLGMGAV